MKPCLVLKVLKALVRFPVVMRLWETPVPMPNTTVKTQAADDTWLETARESKWLPESNIKAKRFKKPQAETAFSPRRIRSFEAKLRNEVFIQKKTS